MLELPALRAALERSADPVAGRMLVGRLLEAHPTLADELASDEEMAAAIVAVVTASRSLFTALDAIRPR